MKSLKLLKYVVFLLLIVVLLVCLHYNFNEKYRSYNAVRNRLIRWPERVSHSNETAELTTKQTTDPWQNKPPPTKSSTNNTTSLLEDGFEHLVVQRRFENRFQRIEQQCEKRKLNYLGNWEHTKSTERPSNIRMVANDQYQVIACLGLKAGSSSWHDFFWKLRAPEEHEKFDFWQKAIYGNENHYKRMNLGKLRAIWRNPNSTRMVTVRHPMARLVSRHNDKFTTKYYHKMLPLRYPLMKKYPNHFGKWNDSNGPFKYFMEWEDFADYLADHGKEFRKTLDEHFHPIIGQCDPCRYPFNYVVKLETFNEDLRWLMEHRFNKDIAQDIRRMNTKNQKSTREIIKENYSKLKPSTVKKIYELYEVDMLMFGYTFNLTTLEAGGLTK